MVSGLEVADYKANLVPGISIARYTVSPDGQRVVFTQKAGNGGLLSVSGCGLLIGTLLPGNSRGPRS